MDWKKINAYRKNKPYKLYELTGLRLSAQIHYDGKIHYRKNLNPNDFEMRKLLRDSKFKGAFFFNQSGIKVAELSRRWGAVWTVRLTI